VQEDEDLSLQDDDDDDQAAVAEAVAAAGTVPYMLQGLLSATKKKRTLIALYEKNPDTGMISNHRQSHNILLILKSKNTFIIR
jgi:hypothetical protein